MENLKFIEEATVKKSPGGEPAFRTILLLGAGESGKSTIAKQIKILYHGGFTAAEAARYKETIHQNVISSIKTLLEAAAIAGSERELHSETLRDHVLAVRASNDRDELTRELGESIKILWGSGPVRRAWEASSKLQVIESAAYFFDDIDRLSSEVYYPTNNDILRSRTKTTGINPFQRAVFVPLTVTVKMHLSCFVSLRLPQHASSSGISELFFEADGKKYKLIDVGGQRSERRKWLNTYAVDEGISAIIYCISMSSFDQLLAEDIRVNRMEEEVELFRQTSNSTWFKDAPTLLLLNKADLFREKIKRIDLKEKLPHYTGDNNFDEASKFLIDKLTSLKRNEMKALVTCAMDSEDVVRVVKDATRLSQANKMMKSSGSQPSRLA